MGEKNRSGFRVEEREGKNILVVDFRYRTKDGREKRYRRDAHVQTKTAARVEAEQLMRYALEHGTVEPPPAVPTFERFVRDQFVPLAMPEYKPSTRERYERLLFKEGILATLGAKAIDEIGSRELMELSSMIRARGAIPRQHHVLVRVVLKRAVQFGVLSRMPDLPVAPKQSRKLPAAPTIETIAILLRGSEGWLRYAIALAYFANMRNSEARAFQVRDADFKSGVVTVRRTFSHDELCIPKSGAERSIPMAKRLKAILAEAVRDKKPTAFIVADASGEPPSRQLLYKTFRALEKRLGIDPQWSFHALRHAFGTHAVSLGANVEAVRDLMGHKDLTTTTRYVHAVAKDKAAVITALNGQLAGNG